MTFTEYATQNGLKLLRDDINFIKRMTKGLIAVNRKSILIKYVEIWVDAMNNEQSFIKKQGKGRLAANVWLRSVLE
jgi:hypothetical protein